MLKRLHVLFSGTVQGIGFRYTTESLANRLNLNGWVKNLRSGQVEIIAEGKEGDLKEFLVQIKDQFGGYISDIEESWGLATEEFKKFGIEF